VLGEREESGAVVRQVRLEFGPDRKARLCVELLLPRGPGPFPVLLVQRTHRAWALVALSRGYVGCVYDGDDSRDDTDGFAPLWPDFDWGKLARRAWAAGRCVDYLQMLPAVDKKKIAITGHSRNGKVALIAAALDERIAAVVSSSSGQCGACSYRLFAEPQMAESIEVLSRENPSWVHPRLRFFAGREDRLPIDQHEMIALVAPRACLLATARNDNTESTWAVQHTYLAARPVYDLLGAGDRLRIAWRPGGHETRAGDIHTYLDWCDLHFGRGRAEFPEVLLHPRYQDWQKAGETIDASRFPPKGLDDLLQAPAGRIADAKDWPAQRAALRRGRLWALGEEPPAAAGRGGGYGAEPAYRATLLKRFLNPPPGIARQGVNFGDYVAGDLYYPEQARAEGKKLPAVVWLNPHSCARGYVPSALGGGLPHLDLIRAGLVVFAYDAVGTGYRIEEETCFYQRYPHWSLLGKMVRDARAAVDALEKVPFVDGRRIFLAGYGLGGRVALHTAALDERVAGVVSLAGFTPLRLDTADKGTGGVARLSHLHVLQPRLGAFLGRETRIPYDFHEVLALIAPRPVLLVTPRLDRTGTLADVEACVRAARPVFALLGAADNLRHLIPETFNRYSPRLRQELVPTLREMAGLAKP
jgi:dienelactone hydrolase